MGPPSLCNPTEAFSAITTQLLSTSLGLSAVPSGNLTSGVTHTARGSTTWNPFLPRQKYPSSTSLVSRLDSVGLTLTDRTTFTHGGTGGTAVSLTLGSSEYWVTAELCQGQKSGETRNFYILATASAGNTLSAGTSTSDCSTFSSNWMADCWICWTGW